MNLDVTCGDVYGDGLILNGRISYDRNTWLPFDGDTCELIVANYLSVAGEMPVLASRAVVSDRVRALLARAGLPLPSNLLTYSGRGEHVRILGEHVGRGGNVVLVHAVSESEVPTSGWWVDPDVWSEISNKGNLGSLVPEEFCPRRRIVPIRELQSATPEPPLVIKVPTDEPNGGGFDVAVCRSSSEIAAALRRFESCDHLVVEEFLEMRRNLCLNYAVFHTGEVKYLGAAEQIIGGDGFQTGNWFGVEPAPETMVRAGLMVMERARDRGYFGFAGFDACVTSDDRIVLFDLNFRLQGCTAPLLVFEARFGESAGSVVGRTRKWSGREGFESLSGTLEPWIDRGEIIPMALFDDGEINGRNAKAACTLLTCGKSRDDVERIDRQLRESGLYS